MKIIESIKNISEDKKKSLEGFAFILIIVFLGMLARALMFPVVSGDQKYFLVPWYNFIKANGGFRAVGLDFGDYMPTYYYILAFLTYLPFKAVTGIKIVSCIADVILALVAMKIVEKSGASKDKSIIAFAVVFMLPTVMLNSAAWAQCDAIFTIFLLCCVLSLMEGKDTRAVAFFAAAFVFKIQAIFLAPFLLLLFLKKKIRLRACLAFPVVYMISILPAVLAGGNFFRLLTVYGRQAGQYSALNMHIPNIWAMVMDVKCAEIGRAGVFFAGAVIIILLFACYRKKFTVTPKLILIGSAVSAILVPYLLPFMHERYYYFAEVICVILAFTYSKYFWIPVVMQFCSWQGLAFYLFKKDNFDMRILLIFVTAVLVALIYLFIKEIHTVSTDKEEFPQALE